MGLVGAGQAATHGGPPNERWKKVRACLLLSCTRAARGVGHSAQRKGGLRRRLHKHRQRQRRCRCRSSYCNFEAATNKLISLPTLPLQLWAICDHFLMQLQLMHKGRLAIYADICIIYNACERKKRLARIGIRRPNSQLGPALRLTTGRGNFYIK